MYRIPGKRLKYRNKPQEYDGIKFDSMAEAVRYRDLKLLQHAKEIRDLEVHPKFPLVVNGFKIATYEADFGYTELTGVRVVEDVKSAITKTPVYRIKKKLMHALYGIDVKEVMR